METTNICVEGMNCASCAISIKKSLQKQGLEDVKVNYASGDVSFINRSNISLKSIENEIKELGYTVIGSQQNTTQEKKVWSFKSSWNKFLFCVIFTAPLFISHLIHIHWLMNPVVQLALTTPVYFVGMMYFGKSAIKSLMKGFPNMNVLIALGSTAAYFYSLFGLLTGKAMEFMFFETTATTLTLVFLGNALEEKTNSQTQQSLKNLMKSQTVKATMIAFDDKYQEQLFTVEGKDLKVGDLILVKTGEQVPADCKILWGNGNVNEAIVTGESAPLTKQQKDILIGGSIVEDGSFKAQVTAAGNDSVLSQIIKLIQDAQNEKPPMQQLADKISAIFVPSVIVVAILTLAINYFVAKVGFNESLLRCVAVMVIACPCAMGLATPAAIAVGLGRASNNGVLFKDAKSLELIKTIKQVVFDKTGTLTTGKFSITNYELGIWNKELGISDEDFKRIAYSLEKYSNHPLAKTITANWKATEEIRWSKVEEVKGLGIIATDKENNIYKATSYKEIQQLTNDYSHNIYISKNNELIGWIDVADEIREEAANVIQWFKRQGIKTILLSGDKKEKCELVAKQIGIDEVYAEQTPDDKIDFIAQLNSIAPTAMVGDGINDAPALAKATLGISLSEASQLAIQSAQVVLMKSGLKKLPFALGIGKHTYITIQQNLFWALIYNVIAIPVAAVGLLGKYGPTYGAIIMGLSDVILAVNSIRLRWKKVEL
ncbi:MAG: heavy metal translocating P-type ATPase [Chitinophagaceae bacterium]